ncbi:hypothetical protein V6Z11_D07G128700 [Gossypium hirsutum]
MESLELAKRRIACFMESNLVTPAVFISTSDSASTPTQNIMTFASDSKCKALLLSPRHLLPFLPFTFFPDFLLSGEKRKTFATKRKGRGGGGRKVPNRRVK